MPFDVTKHVTQSTANWQWATVLYVKRLALERVDLGAVWEGSALLSVIGSSTASVFHFLFYHTRARNVVTVVDVDIVRCYRARHWACTTDHGRGKHNLHQH